MSKITWRKCVVKGCRALVGSNQHRNKCAKHHYHAWRDAHPLECSYNHLKKRAKERGHEFTLTFGEYREFAIKTDYHKLKGKTSLSLSIDRKDNDKGYTKENIQALSLAENSRKQHVPYFRQHMEETMAATHRAIEEAYP